MSNVGRNDIVGPFPFPSDPSVQQHFQKAQAHIETQTLYVVATPIGNLSDISLRALAVLSRADLICAEDTRVTAQLLSAYGIKTKLISVREHNEQHMATKIIAALHAGEVVAQVSDAGTPAVCDPGAKLVERVRAAGLQVCPIAGPSAVMAALSVAEVSEPDFYFAGFIPAKAGERDKLLHRWAQAEHAIVAFETPHRIAATLAAMMQVFPERQIMLAREISKTYETFLRGTVAEVQAALAADSNQSRGEMVLVLHPLVRVRHKNTLPESAQAVISILAAALPTKQAAELAAKITQENKKILYDFAINLKKT